jgi:hypothetical protein
MIICVALSFVSTYQEGLLPSFSIPKFPSTVAASHSLRIETATLPGSIKTIGSLTKSNWPQLTFVDSAELSGEEERKKERQGF